MEDNTRLELLLQLIERPEDFPERIKDEMLEDDECRELYEKLCEVRRAMAAEQVNKEEQTPDAMREWRRFRRSHVTHRRSAWRVAVVSVTSLAVVSVLAFAMLHPKGTGNDARNARENTRRRGFGISCRGAIRTAGAKSYKALSQMEQRTDDRRSGGSVQSFREHTPLSHRGYNRSGVTQRE